MTDLTRLAATVAAIAAISMLTACKPEADGAAANGSEPAADDSRDAAASKSALIQACTIKLAQPEAHEWTTYWDPAHTRTAGQNPSGVRSVHWANEDETRSALQMDTAIPLNIVCASDERMKPSIAFDIVAFDSTMQDVPLAPGTYVIAPKASPAKNKPGEFIVGNFLFGESMFAAKSGTLKIERFDKQGVAGSFVIDGNEILMGSRPLHVEGTFDMPCRVGMLQSACASDKAETTD